MIIGITHDQNGRVVEPLSVSTKVSRHGQIARYDDAAAAKVMAQKAVRKTETD